MYQELTGQKKPTLDRNNILHWPVLLLYPEVMSSDFIEDFCETDMFSAHLDMISFAIPPIYRYTNNKYEFLSQMSFSLLNTNLTNHSYVTEASYCFSIIMKDFGHP